MLLTIISYALHLLIVIPFFLLLPLPVMIRSTEAEKNNKSLLKVLKSYKVILMVAHGALVIALVTGLILRLELSVWVVGVVLLWVAIGAFLGFTAKFVRLSLEALNDGKKPEDSLQKAKMYSFLLTISISIMFVVKYTM